MTPPGPDRGGPPPAGPDPLAPVREFRADPFGPRSPELTRILDRMRALPIEGKHCVVCTRPHAEWRLAVMSGRRGVAPRLLHNTVFHTLADAEWAVFKLRWRDLTGQEIDDDAL